MRVLIPVFLAAVLLIVTACGGGAAAPTPPLPTAQIAPTATPIPPTATPVASADTNSVDVLSGTSWQWVKLSDPAQEVEIDNPAGYVVTFSNGTLAITADCNRAQGSYQVDANGVLSTQIGPTTLAACPPGSRSEEFVQKLGLVARFFFQDDRLFLELPADGGTLEFTRFSPAANEPVTDVLSGTSWQWVKLSDPAQEVEIQNSVDYTISFANGTVDIKADCNLAGGTYTLGAGGTLTILLGPTTTALCPAGSRSEEFLTKLQFVTRYSFDGDRLRLEMMADGGTLEFIR